MIDHCKVGISLQKGMCGLPPCSLASESRFVSFDPKIGDLNITDASLLGGLLVGHQQRVYLRCFLGSLQSLFPTSTRIRMKEKERKERKTTQHTFLESSLQVS